MPDVLDNGYIKLVDSWGSEEGIIEAAKMSTSKSFKGWGPLVEWKCSTCGIVPATEVYECEEGGWGHAKPDGAYEDGTKRMRCWRRVNKITDAPGDEKLLRFLYEHKHMTPFEMAGVTIEVQAPIFVFREWHRHRVPFSYNEMSARYAPLPDVNYVPTVERLMMNGGSNKQAQGTGEALTYDAAQYFRGALIDQYRLQQELYESALARGVPKELARVMLPVGRYSRMRASANLRGWLAFLTLREAGNAQWEIRQYAHALHKILAEKFPRTLSLFEEGEE